MLEVFTILTLLFVGAIVVGAIALLAGLIKFTVKLALLPIVLGLKALVVVLGFVIALVVGGLGALLAVVLQHVAVGLAGFVAGGYVAWNLVGNTVMAVCLVLAAMA